jgi:hypothetical protein
VDRSGLGYGPVERCCEHGNEPSGCVECSGRVWVAERLAASQGGLSCMQLVVGASLRCARLPSDVALCRNSRKHGRTRRRRSSLQAGSGVAAAQEAQSCAFINYYFLLSNEARNVSEWTLQRLHATHFHRTIPRNGRLSSETERPGRAS